MAKLVASAFAGTNMLWLYLDDKLIIENSSDVLTVELRDSEEFVIHWFVRGMAGSQYTITISSPKDAQFQLTRVIGRGGKDHGAFRFRT
jgi:hypothetical protein